MTRDSGERLEGRKRCACSRRISLCALDIEWRRQPGALARGHEAQRFVVRSRDCTYRVELAQGAHQHEIVRCNVGDGEKANASGRMFGRSRVSGSCSGARTESPGDVDFPGNIDAALPTLRRRGLRYRLLGRRAISGSVVEAGTMNPDARVQPGTANRLAGSRRTHAFQRDPDIPVLARGSADKIRQDRIAIGVPPGGFWRFDGRRCGCESARHIDRRLEHGSRTPDEGEGERCGQLGGDMVRLRSRPQKSR